MNKLCAGGVRLRDQVDARFPKRDKRSDGWIGDAAHQTAGSASQHNPDSEGIVYAIDLGENMGKGRARNGRTAMHLANQLLAYASSTLPGSNRLMYVVYEGKIASGTYKKTWWKWRGGKDWGHYQHIHVSFNKSAKHDNTIFPLPVLTSNPVKKLKWSRDLKNAQR
jgi:hypothetical protein